MGSLRVSSHQPSFLPYVGFWNKLASTDLFIVMAGVQYTDRNYQNRVKLNGSWLTLPVQRNHRVPLYQVHLADTLDLLSAAKRIEQTLCCKRYRYGHRLEEVLWYLRTSTGDSLVSVTVPLQIIIASMLGITCRVELDFKEPDHQLDKTERLVKQVRRWAVDPIYYAGAGAVEHYIDRAKLPFRLMAQRVREDACNETILQVIAGEPDPADYVRMAATWEEVHG